MKLATTLCLLFVLSVSLAYAQTPQPLSAKEILDKTVSVYASCASYADEGEVKTIFLQSNGTRTVVKPFSTAFVRPSQFRFEFEDPMLGDRTSYVVWRNESSIKSWWTLKPKTMYFEKLSEAVAGATGVSGGSAIMIPSLLMSDLGDSHRIQTLTQLKLTGEEQLAGRKAFRIEGRDRRNQQVTIWIDRGTFLVLKVYETRKFDHFETEQTTTYRPRINESILPEKLSFNH